MNSGWLLTLLLRLLVFAVLLLGMVALGYVIWMVLG